MSRRRIAGLGAVLLVLTVWPLSGAGRALVMLVPAEPPDAIVSLASHEWERLPVAAALAGQYPQSLVLLTEPAAVTDSNCHRCGERTSWLVQLGVAPERIHVLPDRGSGTWDEAVAVRRYVDRHPVRRIAIVTSPYHTRRAWGAFREAFGTMDAAVGIYPACAHAPARPDRWWTSPYDRSYVVYEWAALVQYGLKFGVSLRGHPSARREAEDFCKPVHPGVASERPA